MPVAPPASYLVFDDKAFRLRLGVHPLDVSRWLDCDEAFEADMAEKSRLLCAHHDTVVRALPDSESASEEVLEAIITSTLCDGEASALPAGLHPIDAAGRLVQEDLCLFLPRSDGRLALAAASVCFPLRWDLRSKMGRSVGEVHGPVPGYAEHVRDAVDRVIDRLRPDAGFWRCNWSVVDDPALHQSAGINRVTPRADVTVSNVAGRAWLRVERQTLRRFPAHNSVLFTIHTYQCAVGAFAHDPSVCARLAGAIRALPRDMARYKSLPTLTAPLLDWLDQQSQRVRTTGLVANGP